MAAPNLPAQALQSRVSVVEVSRGASPCRQSSPERAILSDYYFLSRQDP